MNADSTALNVNFTAAIPKCAKNRPVPTYAAVCDFLN